MRCGARNLTQWQSEVRKYRGHMAATAPPCSVRHSTNPHPYGKSRQKSRHQCERKALWRRCSSAAAPGCIAGGKVGEGVSAGGSTSGAASASREITGGRLAAR